MVHMIASHGPFEKWNTLLLCSLVGSVYAGRDVVVGERYCSCTMCMLLPLLVPVERLYGIAFAWNLVGVNAHNRFIDCPGFLTKTQSLCRRKMQQQRVVRRIKFQGFVELPQNSTCCCVAKDNYYAGRQVDPYE